MNLSEKELAVPSLEVRELSVLASTIHAGFEEKLKLENIRNRERGWSLSFTFNQKFHCTWCFIASGPHKLQTRLWQKLQAKQKSIKHKPAHLHKINNKIMSLKTLDRCKTRVSDRTTGISRDCPGQKLDIQSPFSGILPALPPLTQERHFFLLTQLS